MKSENPSIGKLIEKDDPTVICRMPSGWAQLANMQYLRGYCILTAEPQVPSLNDLDAGARERFLLDMSLIGDALLEVTDSHRINYAIAGNNLQLLHAHIVPRYKTEPDDMLHNHPWAYPPEVMSDTPVDPLRDGPLIKELAEAITRRLKINRRFESGGCLFYKIKLYSDSVISIVLRVTAGASRWLGSRAGMDIRTSSPLITWPKTLCLPSSQGVAHVGDEELAAVGARAGIGHREDAGLVVFQGRIELILELVPGTAHAGAGRVAALHHEIVDHPVEDGVVVESFACQEDQVVDRLRGLGCE